jgi:TM2 domain-containing membrane protein YozV
MLGSSDSSSATLPFSKAEAFKAIISVAQKMKGFKIKDSDEMLGRVNLTTSASATSWGESIPIQLNEKDENKTEISIVSKSKTGVLAGGALTKKNEQNVELLLSNVSKFLQGKEIVVKGGSEKGLTITLLIAIFFGWLGLHRFYVGKWKTGLLYMFTLGGLGIGVVIDLVRLIMGNFTDKEDNYVSNW